MSAAPTTNGGKIQLDDRNATGARKWTVSNGALVNTSAPSGSGLDDPAKKDVAMEIVSAAESSSLDWRARAARLLRSLGVRWRGRRGRALS